MIHHFQSLQHQKNLVRSKDRLELLKHVEARMNEDGLKQTKYQVVGRIETELFTKITVSLLYDEQLFSTKKKGKASTCMRGSEFPRLVANCRKNNVSRRRIWKQSKLNFEGWSSMARVNVVAARDGFDSPLSTCFCRLVYTFTRLCRIGLDFVRATHLREENKREGCSTKKITRVVASA